MSSDGGRSTVAAKLPAKLATRRPAKLVATLVCACVFVSSAGPALAATPSFATAVGEFMCVSCHEPLAQVSSPQALSEKQYLSGLLARRLTLAQVRAAMVGQYGPQVLAQPPASGFNLSIYVLPPAVLLGGLALLVYTLPKWRERSRRAAATPLPGAGPLDTDDARRLDDELTNFI